MEMVIYLNLYEELKGTGDISLIDIFRWGGGTAVLYQLRIPYSTKG